MGIKDSRKYNMANVISDRMFATVHVDEEDTKL